MTPVRPAVRRLTRQHFALYRGYLEGATIEGLHTAYGEPGTDVRVTRRLIATLRDTLAVAARRARDIEAAHLLRLKPGSIPLAELHGTDDVPTLDVYRDRVDPDHVYSEAELLDLYLADYPPEATPRMDRRIARNARLRQRQATALARMEKALVQDPRPDHPLDGWFEPVVAGRLRAAGLSTLADLLALIGRRRNRWHMEVPKLGPKGAQRILDWLSLHASSLGQVLSPLATTPRRQLHAGHPALSRPPIAGTVPDVVPMEALRVSAELDGSRGLNRAPVPAHQAELATDLAAIAAWVNVRGARSPDTARAYRREAERLLLWAVVEKRKPLSSLNTLDCSEYIEVFLKDPQPAERWVGNRRVERFEPAWRPFTGKALSDRSREIARKVLRSMCSWLVGERYLASNPFHGLPKSDDIDEIDATGRTLTHAQWKYVLQTTTRVTYTREEQRDHFILLFAYATGLRRAELARATTGDLSRTALDGALADAWELKVHGKGRRKRHVPMPVRLMAELERTLQARREPPLGKCPKETPLIAHLQTGQPLTPDAVARLFKRIFKRAADQLEATYPGSADDLKKASTHWLRHTHVNHTLDSGADVRDVQVNLGHASLGTTTIYTKGDSARRYKAVNAFFDGALAEADK
ncbi:phage integrase family protein [Paraburkholderia dioscoreae]|uniref:Integrase family protein n=1 Tax=Paraburkholderia dioscoreae TaxID=2604047 RepID=A0A5Q4ZI78_9BURK|nr:phage integrase family protein [Paraburkholderia dioscoreae]VVD31056.1 Integrase family protein [Paraburkholderia dioscoreae]